MGGPRTLNQLCGAALESPAKPPRGPPQAGVRAVGYRAQDLPGDRASSSGLGQGSGPALPAELNSQKRPQDHRAHPCAHLQAWELRLFSVRHCLPLTFALLIHLPLCVGMGCGLRRGEDMVAGLPHLCLCCIFPPLNICSS